MAKALFRMTWNISNHYTDDTIPKEELKNQMEELLNRSGDFLYLPITGGEEVVLRKDQIILISYSDEKEKKE